MSMYDKYTAVVVHGCFGGSTFSLFIIVPLNMFWSKITPVDYYYTYTPGIIVNKIQQETTEYTRVRIYIHRENNQ